MWRSPAIPLFAHALLLVLHFLQCGDAGTLPACLLASPCLRRSLACRATT